MNPKKRAKSKSRLTWHRTRRHPGKTKRRNRIRAIIHLNGIPDHKEPWDYKYCVKLAFLLDPLGKSLIVKVVSE
jgi:hypothetical protein